MYVEFLIFKRFSKVILRCLFLKYINNQLTFLKSEAGLA